MRSSLRLFFLLPLTAVLACGSSSPSGNASLFTTPSGDWVLNINSTTASGTFSGALAIQGNNVSGTFNVPGSCAPGVAGISVTGSINSSGSAMTLTSASFSGSVANFTIQLPLISTAQPNYTFGTLQITGGSCAMPSTPLIVNYVNYGGSYSGTLTGTATGQATLSFALGSANSNGQFTVTGASMAFSSSTCNFSATGTLSGFIIGYSLQLNNLAGPAITVTADATTYPISLSVNGPCGGALEGTIH